MSKSDNPDEILHRFLDLANQADRKGIVLFSNFLNMYEINLLHQNENLFNTGFSLYGGYQEAERQMVAFQPDALYYNWGISDFLRAGRATQPSFFRGSVP